MHGNIVKFIESFDNENGNLCIVMEYCDAGDLKKMIKSKGNNYQISEDEAIFYTI